MGVIFFIILIVGIIIYAITRKKKIAEEISTIRQTINSDVGLLGEDIDSVLVNVTPANYTLPQADLEKLRNAKGSYLFPDHPEYINQVLAGKSKAQIKAICAQFQNAYGIKFNDHLNSIFSDLFGYDTAGYQAVLNIVKSAK
ncbi:hypothetical protein MYP_647 [Sporocytophaga myxococcoides]|uniref:Uncharacterized protein n=1 Tax=Sporocytophaga myxococcoides TaxID=153721 RepID=A0A098L966_9BACT|nr:hypothetical protein MYP_647 [Sporocytophaga myxococcoides]